MTLDEVKALHPHWTIDPIGLDLHCQYGPWRFRAADPDDADREIERREKPVTAQQPGRLISGAGA